MARTFNTLFLLTSLDGKISTGDIDSRDIDKDLPKIKGVREGLSQYYEIERTTDLHSLNTGRVMVKVGMNIRNKKIVKTPASFIIIDNKPHLTLVGIQNMLKKGKCLYVVTTNKAHPAFRLKGEKRIRIIYYAKQVNFKHLFSKLRKEFGVRRITLQSGGTLNAILLRGGLIDEVSIVVAPILIGGQHTSSLIDGKSLRSEKDLRMIKALRLKKAKILKNSYLHLRYSVIN